MKKLYRIFLCAGALLLVTTLSCSIRAERKSFTAALDQIDILINQRQYKDALKELSLIEKNASTPLARLGIYKRYRLLGEDAKAEKILTAALKKNPDNPDLIAVYTNLLLRTGRIEDALKQGEPLKGSKYGSIYSEAVLTAAAKEKEENAQLSFLTSDYFPIFFDAWIGSKNQGWLRNCAVIDLLNGSYADAAALRPSEIYSADSAYFWSLVMYDAARFIEAAAYAEHAAALYDSAAVKLRRRVLKEGVMCIAADAYTSARELEKAEAVRQAILKTAADGSGGWVLSEDGKTDFMRVIFVNSARWAADNDNDPHCAELLIFTINKWPDYIPALTSYADFALRTSPMRQEDYEQTQLRDQGLATLEMERYDNRARIPISDAVTRIEESIQRTGEPLLYILRLNLKYKTDETLSLSDKKADLWHILEQNQTAPGRYPPLMLDFALSFLLRHNGEKDAFDLFYKYARNKYAIDAEDFWDGTVRNIRQFSAAEAEYAAYFAAQLLRSDDALRLYEYCVFENGGNEAERIVSPLVSDYACMNLAQIYASRGSTKSALELYSKAAGRTADLKIKSLLMFRMAKIYNASKDYKNARLSVEYALTLNPRNAEARLLFNKLKML